MGCAPALRTRQQKVSVTVQHSNGLEQALRGYRLPIEDKVPLGKELILSLHAALGV